jgi:integrase
MARPRLDSPNYKLVRRGDTFYVRWWQDGKWQRVSTGARERRQATIWLAQFVAGRGTPAAPEQPTISMILDGYLADRKPVIRSFASLQSSAKALNKHLGDLAPEHLTKERVRFYRARRKAEGQMVGPADARRRKPSSDGTIIHDFHILKAALRWAKNHRWITDVPWIEMPKEPAPRDRWLTREEADRLLDASPSLHVRTFLALCIYTGARSGAIRELTWDRVDLAAGRIDLGMITGGKGRAVIPLADALRPYLAKAREAATCSFVVEYAGRPVGSLKTATRAAATRAGLAGVTPHVLRHTAATWMMQAGVPIEQVARMLGHRDVRITWNTYAKHSPDYLMDAVKALSG